MRRWTVGDGCLGGSAVPKDDGKYRKNKHAYYLKGGWGGGFKCITETSLPQKYGEPTLRPGCRLLPECSSAGLKVHCDATWEKLTTHTAAPLQWLCIIGRCCPCRREQALLINHCPKTTSNKVNINKWKPWGGFHFGPSQMSSSKNEHENVNLSWTDLEWAKRA